jgi:hypothetical protein
MFLVDIQQQTVKLVHDGAPIRSAARFMQVVQQSGPSVRIAMRTDSSVEVLDAIDGHFVRSYSIPEDLRDVAFQFGLNSDSEMILEVSGPPDSLSSTNTHRFLLARKDGSLVDRMLTLAQVPSGRPFQSSGGLRMPAPALFAAEVAFDRGAEIVRNHVEPTWSAAARRLVAEYYPTFLTALVLSLACAAASLARLSRYSASRWEKTMWPLFVLLFGVPGWIGFRFCRSWPVLETCTACKVRVPRNQEVCKACEAEFPLPARLGTEVFA